MMHSLLQGDKDDKQSSQTKVVYDDKNLKAIAQLPKHEQVLFALFCTFEMAATFLRFMGFVTIEIVATRWAGLVFDLVRIERFTFVHLEIIGLLVLRHKIKARNSVAGLSATTMIMYAFVIALRIIVPATMTLQGWSREVPSEITVGIFSFLLVLDILKAIFVTHKDTYQSDLDVLKTSYLIPVCLILALLLHPNLPYYPWHLDVMWTLNAMFDMVALMPQVVMMSRGGGKVEAPIANFVAAVFISRFGDIIHSFVFDQDVLAAAPVGFVLAVSSQLVQLVIVADFMYYYCKARSHKDAGFESDMTLPKEALGMIDV